MAHHLDLRASFLPGKHRWRGCLCRNNTRAAALTVYLELAVADETGAAVVVVGGTAVAGVGGPVGAGVEVVVGVVNGCTNIG